MDISEHGLLSTRSIHVLQQYWTPNKKKGNTKGRLTSTGIPIKKPRADVVNEVYVARTLSKIRNPAWFSMSFLTANNRCPELYTRWKSKADLYRVPGRRVPGVRRVRVRAKGRYL